MPAVAVQVLSDAQATPVLHSFHPVGQDASRVWWYEDQTAASAVGFNRLSIAFVRPGNPAPGASSENRVYRVKVGLHTPKLEILGNSGTGVTPSPRIAYVPRMNLEFVLPDRSSIQDRADLMQMTRDALHLSYPIQDMVANLRGIY